MDSVDLRLIRTLVKDPKMPLRKMAREVGLSISGVRKRIKQLEKDRLIRYSVLIDPKKYGYSVTAFVAVEAETRCLKELVNQLSRKHEVCELHRASGEDALIVKLRAADVSSLNRFVEEHIRSNDFVRNTTTWIALETYKESFLNP